METEGALQGSKDHQWTIH